jgi:radical SAM protein with 4Fe4S-binding SPASM domain
VNDPILPRPPAFGGPFVLQWHLNDVCNLACRHCYRPEGPVRSALEPGRVLEELLAFLRQRGQGGRLHLAGGEPTLCPELPEIVAEARRHKVGCRVLSNGTKISSGLARALGEAGCLGVQVSLEGPEGIHDEVRGSGTFQLALEGTQRLREAGVQVTFSMTLHAANLPWLDATWRLARAHADRFYVSRLVPAGRGGQLLPLTRRQWGQVMQRLQAMAREAGPEVALRDPCFRSLLAAPWHAARAPVAAGCAAGWQCLTVESDGTLMPCRRMGVSLGRLGEQPLDQVWREHPLLLRLRDRDQLEGACGRCAYRWVCGGCRAIPQALTQNPFGADPQCPAGSWLGRSACTLRHGIRAGVWKLRTRRG